MTLGSTEYMETSGPVGIALIAFGVGSLLANHFLGVFTAWSWALLVGGGLVAFGTLFLYPDVRLYQYEQSPLEQLVIDDATEPIVDDSAD